jgi:hypothetical protein
MRSRRRAVRYAGQPYNFERVERWEPGEDGMLWAVSRRGEFIGTLTSPKEISTKEFDLRCTQWLTELLGGSGPRRH